MDNRMQTGMLRCLGFMGNPPLCMILVASVYHDFINFATILIITKEPVPDAVRDRLCAV